MTQFVPSGYYSPQELETIAAIIRKEEAEEQAKAAEARKAQHGDLTNDFGAGVVLSVDEVEREVRAARNNGCPVIAVRPYIGTNGDHKVFLGHNRQYQKVAPGTTLTFTQK